MNPEDSLRALRDDDRWQDRPFVLRDVSRPHLRSSGRRGVLAASLALAAVAAGLLVLGLSQAVWTPAAPATTPAAAAPAVPWTSARPGGVGPLVQGPVSPTLPVHAAIAAPATARAGSVLAYTVTLTNTSAKAVRLSPCPTYTEAALPSGVPLRYRLNCTPVRALPPSSAVRFAMRLALPADPGAVTLRWTLADGPTATARVTLTR
ncbi:hypothetical protein QDR37_16195 [Amnibacterium sp. CER49]|uniref:hypothetical protein n=1 Tax=Amnibacterium sp. CER49 TaxID=3039161 RepID=UPI002448AADF|nr:hypothetical protein [Amnibacterium sp. CER49]MDH2445488.1 hypothetical protein [Amnibacterium sp. CER49]